MCVGFFVCVLSESSVLDINVGNRSACFVPSTLNPLNVTLPQDSQSLFLLGH